MTVYGERRTLSAWEFCRAFLGHREAAPRPTKWAECQECGDRFNSGRAAVTFSASLCLACLSLSDRAHVGTPTSRGVAARIAYDGGNFHSAEW